MTIFLYEPRAWHIIAGIIGIGVAIWRLRKYRTLSENRGPIVVDGWVARWADDPAAYEADRRLVRKREWDAIGVVLFNVAVQVLIWMAR